MSEIGLFEAIHSAALGRSQQNGLFVVVTDSKRRAIGDIYRRASMKSVGRLTDGSFRDRGDVTIGNTGSVDR
ncbi:MAG TPA: hypothetical protein VGH29_00400 [Candidatus Binataceae bacterium]